MGRLLLLIAVVCPLITSCRSAFPQGAENALHNYIYYELGVSVSFQYSIVSAERGAAPRMLQEHWRKEGDEFEEVWCIVVDQPIPYRERSTLLSFNHFLALKFGDLWMVGIPTNFDPKGPDPRGPEDWSYFREEWNCSNFKNGD